MSKTIDERVVEMRFDNSRFESNVQTSMSTLDKLKEKLNFNGATKGLENVATAAKNVDMSGLSNSVDTVGLKFDAMYTMADQALRNIVNSAMNAGKRIVSALTIDPVTTGFNEYELKMDSIKTIMASTGEDVKTVNEYLEELNKYSDQTIYSFADMTQNIGKFTNSGVKLEDAVLAIKGISNEAAVSGANANEASRAMYNFAQALSAGYVKLIDWKSIELANMATMEFKEELLSTALALGTVVKQGDKYISTTTNAKGETSDLFTATTGFNDSLNAQWMTTDVLIQTLGRYADETTDIGKKAFAAAQDVTKLTQVYDILKETAQSGWAKTWELIFGDINQAKSLFTPLTNFLSGVINAMSDARNNLLEGALNFASPWESIMEKLDKAGLGKIKKIADEVQNFTDKLEYFQDIVSRVWIGEFATSDTGRYEMLEKAGYDHRVVQDLVNKGYNYKLTVEDIEASHKKFGLTMEKNAKNTEEVTETLANLSDEQLRNAGLTDEEIKLYRDLAREAERTGISISDLAEEMSKNDGRTLLVDSFKNAGQGIVAVFTAIKDAWVEIFPPMSVVTLYNIIKGINQFSEHLRVSDTTADNLKRTLKGVFAIIDIITTIVGGGFKIAFKAVTALLSVFDLDILSLTAIIGDVIVGFRDWIDSLLDFRGIFEKLAPFIKSAASGIASAFSKLGPYAKKAMDWIGEAFQKLMPYLEKAAIWVKDAFVALVPYIQKAAAWVGEAFQKLMPYFQQASDGIRDWIATLKESDNLPRDIIAGLINGLKAGVGAVWNAAMTIGKAVLESVCNFLGIHSPSTKFIEVGQYIIQGLVNGLQNGASFVWDTIKGIGSKCVEILKNIDFGAILAAGLSAGLVYSTVKLSNAIGKFADAFDGLGDLFEGLGDMFEDIGTGVKKYLNASALQKKSKAVLNLAIAIGIMAASIYVLSTIDTGKLWSSIGAIAALAGIIVALSWAVDKVGPKETADLGKLSVTLLGLSGSLLIIAIALKQLAGLSWEDLAKGGLGILGLGGIMVGLIAATKLFNKDADKVGGTLLKLSIALLLMVFIVKQIAKIDNDTLVRGGVAILAFGSIMVGLIAATKLFGKDADKVGSVLLKISIALVLMVLITKLVSGMSVESLIKGGVVMIAFGAIITGLIAATKLAGGNTNKLGSTLLAVSVAIGILAVIVAMLGFLSVEHLVKGTLAVAALSVIIIGLIAATKLAGNAEKIGSTLLMISISIAILAAVATLLGFLSIEHLAKGIIAVGLLGVIVKTLISATKDAQKCVGNLIVITVAITLLTAALVILSFIDSGKLAVASASMALVMGMFAVIVKAGSTAKSSMSTLIIMSAAIVLIGGMLYLLSGLPMESTLAAATSLSLVLVVLAAAMVIISKAGTVSPAALVAVGVMTLVVAALGGVLYLLRDMQVESAIGIAIALSTLLLGLITACLITSMIPAGAAISGAAGLAVFIAIVAAVIAALGALMMIPGFEEIMNDGGRMLGLIGKTIGDFVGGIMGGIISGVGSALLSLLPVFGDALSGFMTNAQGFIEGVRNIDGDFLLKVASLSAGIILLTAAELIAGLASFIQGGSSFAQLGADLSAFMINALPFLAAVKTVDPSALEGVRALAETILIITAARVLDGIASFLTGGSSMAEFGAQLIPFGKAIKDFSSIVKGNVDEEAVTAAANAGKIMADMASTLPNSGGVLGFFMGENDMSTFAAQLVPFGEAITKFSGIVAGNIDEEAVTAAANAGKIIADMAKTLPNSGGVMGWFLGENDMSDFGAQLVLFGDAITEFSKTVDGSIDEEAVAAAANAGKIMAEMASTLPNSGGVLGFFTGENDMGYFGAQLVLFGDAMKTFSESVDGIDESSVLAASNAGRALAEMADTIPNGGGLINLFTGDNNMALFALQLPLFGEAMKAFSKSIDGIDGELVTAAANSGKALAEMANTIPNSGGLISLFTGDSKMDKFGDQLTAFGDGLKGFSDALNGVKPKNLTESANAAKALSEMTNSTPENTEHIVDFGTNLSVFGGKLKQYALNVSEIDMDMLKSSAGAFKSISGAASNLDADSLSSAAKAIDSLVKGIKGMNGIDGSSTTGFTKAMSNLGKVSVDSVVEAFADAYPKIEKAGKNLITNAINGIESRHPYLAKAGRETVNAIIGGVDQKETAAKKAFASLVEKCASAINGHVGIFNSAGNYLVMGFANGISANSYKAEAQARAMAKAAAEAAEDELGIASPSKVGYRIGGFFGLGFIKAIGAYTNKAYAAGTGMADSAKAGLGNAISKIADIVEGNIDAQPTIRPVLDLSDVEAGASSIGSLLGRSNVGVLANVGRISSFMNENGQNGGNSEVVSALNNLRKDVKKINGATYNINGVEYSDGSDVSDAIQTIVRAARIERRV